MPSSIGRTLEGLRRAYMSIHIAIAKTTYTHLSSLVSRGTIKGAMRKYKRCKSTCIEVPGYSYCKW